MTSIPKSALILGLAGTLPFIGATLMLVAPDMVTPLTGMNVLSQRVMAPTIILLYGQIILAFMSGVLWGFATKAEGRQAALGYTLSVIPALWAFFTIGAGPTASAIYLIAGFIGLLALDWTFWQQGLTPEWWMRLRVLLTAVVVACLSVLV